MIGFSHNGHFLGNLAPGKFHLVNLTIFVYLYLQPLAQGVDHTGAHAVQAAGHLVPAAAELAASMKNGKDNLQSRPAGLRLDIHGNAPAVIRDGDGIARIDGHRNVLTVAGQSLVNGVVHNLIYQVVETRL